MAMNDARRKRLEKAESPWQGATAQPPGIPNELDRIAREQLERQAKLREQERRGQQGLATGTVRQNNGVRHIFVGPGMASRFFRHIEQFPHKDELRGYFQGTWYAADSYTANAGGWWRQIIHDVTETETQTRGIDLMKKFTERVLAQGQYDDLEKIKTPQPGEQFDMNQLAVASVLTLNKMVDVIEALAKRVEELEGEVAAQRALPAKTEEPAFKLAKIGDSYEDVRKVG